VAIAIGGGADLIDMGASRYWQPSYYGNLGIDIGRSWALTSSYNQTSTLLHSPVAAPDSYLMQSAMISAGGNLGRGMDLVINVGASRGEVSAEHSLAGTPGEFMALTSGVQLSAAISDGLSTLVNINYFTTKQSGAARRATQATGDFGRTSVRVGLSWALPLFESPRGRRAR
jgi:hypothetical protein